MNIIIDPGHGGIDNNGNYTTFPNKMFTHNNGEVAYEGELNRNIAQALYECFMAEAQFKGNLLFTVKPFNAKDLTLLKRVKFANAHDPETTFFISIHCNAGGGSGFEIFTSPGETKSDDLATCIYNSVEDLYQQHDLPMRNDYSDADPDKESHFYVLTKTKCPAVLLECGFYDNMKDFKLLQNQKFIKDLAFRIYHGIQSYFYENQKN